MSVMGLHPLKNEEREREREREREMPIVSHVQIHNTYIKYDTPHKCM